MRARVAPCIHFHMGEPLRIYLDRTQCAQFRVGYMSEGVEASIRADAILASKRDGYDAYHLGVLLPLGRESIRLQGVGYGWFAVVKGSGADDPN